MDKKYIQMSLHCLPFTCSTPRCLLVHARAEAALFILHTVTHTNEHLLRTHLQDPHLRYLKIVLKTGSPRDP